MTPEKLESAFITLWKNKWTYLSAFVVIAPSSFMLGQWYIETFRSKQGPQYEIGGMTLDRPSSNIHVSLPGINKTSVTMPPGTTPKEIKATHERVDITKTPFCSGGYPYSVTERYTLSPTNILVGQILYIRHSEKFNSMHANRFDQDSGDQVSYYYCAPLGYVDNLTISFTDGNGLSSKPMRVSVAVPDH